MSSVLYLFYFLLNFDSILTIPVPNSNCSNIVCPPVRATVCVKIKQENAGRKETRYVMMSKCEIEFINCFHDVNTTVVAVKFCYAKAKAKLSHEKGMPVKKLKAKSPEAANQLSMQSKNEKNLHSLAKALRQGKGKKVKKLENAKSAEANNQLLMNSGNNQNAPDLERWWHFREKCPHVCPARDVMVCARCAHGVHRTFMSDCYMRMYQCDHPNEKLQLVSRRPCSGLAPLLGEFPLPEEKIAEPQDEDPVLNYLFSDKSEKRQETVLEDQSMEADEAKAEVQSMSITEAVKEDAKEEVNTETDADVKEAESEVEADNKDAKEQVETDVKEAKSEADVDAEPKADAKVEADVDEPDPKADAEEANPEINAEEMNTEANAEEANPEIDAEEANSQADAGETNPEGDAEKTNPEASVGEANPEADVNKVNPYTNADEANAEVESDAETKLVTLSSITDPV